MKIDRKKVANRCGYDHVECYQLAKRLADCPDETLISEIKKISVWNYGKCELGLWADVLDRLDAILEHAVTKVGKWMLRLDLPENAALVSDVVAILEFTGHLIEHSIYRYLYGSWNHILTLFGSENMDILLAVLGLSYNFSKRSNYFVRLDPANKKIVLDRLVSIAQTWGGTENNFGLAACCDPNHFPETAGNVYFEYIPEPGIALEDHPVDATSQAVDHTASSSTRPSDRTWSSTEKIVLHALHKRNQSPSLIMEEILSNHRVPVSKQMALFARIRLATYFSDPVQRQKCIRARLQALSILSYTFEVDERNLYPSLLDELVDVLELPAAEYIGIKACALRTMTAIVNSSRLGINWTSLVSSTGLSSYHGILPSLTRRWVQDLVDGTIEAPGGSTNQQFTTALLSFLYHLACYEENSGPGGTQSTMLNTSGVLDTMLQLISWHTSRPDYLSYVTRAVRVTDQILMTASVNRQAVLTILIDRLQYEVDLVLLEPTNDKVSADLYPTLNTQRSGLMKSILNLLKRLCLATEWSEVMHSLMDGVLPGILRRIFLNAPAHFTSHLALFAMECITNYLYTYPSRLSAMQDAEVTTDILLALTSQPLPKNRDFLVQLPGLFNTLALNARGIEAVQQSGVLTQYLETLVSPDYLPTMKTKRVRDFLSQISYNLTSNTGQNPSNSLTANQMSVAVQELLRTHSGLKSTVFQSLVKCMRRVVALGNAAPANLVTESTPQPDTLLLRPSVELCPTPPGPVTSGPGRTPHHPQSTVSTVRDVSGSVLEDVVMLSGGEDEVEDVEFSRATQTTSVSVRPSRRATNTLDSRSASPTPPLGYKETTLQLADDQSASDSSPLPHHVFLPDFLLNICKFLEKLLPSVLHVTEAMCRHFMSQGGLEVLCDLLRMPGLPYDFPVSAACASLCKIFEDLANSIYLNDVIDPLLECLDSSLEKLSVLQSGEYSIASVLLREYMADEHVLLHELVVVASVICILVQIVDHVKPELRPSLANKWVGRNTFRTLGRLYTGVSWDAAILLRMLFGDRDIKDSDVGAAPKRAASAPSTSKAGEKAGAQTVAPGTFLGDSTAVPQFVEALHIYSLLKPLKLPPDPCQNAFLRQRPELINAAQRILHVASFFINSFTELCLAWGRFFTGRNQSNYRRRRTTLMPNEQLSSSIKYAAFSQISQVLVGLFSWEPSASIRSHPSGPQLVYAMRYAVVRLTNALIHDPTQKGPQNGIANAFFVLHGITRFFRLFRELIDLDLTDSAIKEPLAEVLEEWLVCADRISSTEPSNIEANKAIELDPTIVEPEKYFEAVHQSMLFPLEQLCTRDDLQNLLTRRAVEHLVGMLVSIVPYLFNLRSKESSKLSEPTALAPTVTESSNVIPPALQPSSASLLRSLEEVRRHVEADFASSAAWDEFALIPPSVSADPAGVAPTTDNNTSIPLEPDHTTSPAGPTPQPMETSPVLSGPTSAESSSALQLLEEMGFSRQLASIALDQTGWNTTEAVNLLIATPEQELLASVPTTTRATLDWTGSAVTAPPVSTPANPDNNALARSASAAAMLLASAASSFISSTENAFGQALSRMASVRRPRGSGLGLSPLAIPTTPVSQLFGPEPLAEEVLAQLRDSLKQHMFRACYKIAKRRNSDQILHRITELLLSTGEQERYMDELFGFVGSSLSKQIEPTESTSQPSPTVDLTVVAIDENPIVGLHLTALLFTRCQALCARLAAAHKLPSLLVSWITSCPLPDQASSCSDYYKTLMLSCLILDQYERSVQAVHLRHLSTKLYVNCHSWNWFDDRAMLWHPYANESRRAIDAAFHKGDLFANCHISRRPYAVEFPTMSQVNLDSMHRRPVLLFPSPEEETESNVPTPYENSILHGIVPAGTLPHQRRSVVQALLSQLTKSAQHSAPITSDCLNAMLRILLRLVYSNYDNAQQMIEENFVSVLFTSPHAREFSSEYSTLVGSLIMQVFEDASTVRRVMSEVMSKICQFGAPSSFMGIGTGSNACRDLFYVLSMCAPLFAKDYETARQLALQIMRLSLPDAPTQQILKNYTVERSSMESPLPEFSLSVKQKALVAQLIQLVLKPDDRAQGTPKPDSEGSSAVVAAFSQSSGSDNSGSSIHDSPSIQPDRQRIIVPASIPSQPQAIPPSSSGSTTLGKADALRYLIELVASYKPVAECVALYQEPQMCSSSDCNKSMGLPCGHSFLAQLFNRHLIDSETTELTTSLLENLILMTCESTQELIIAEYKASLTRISNCPPDASDQKGLDEKLRVQRNERLSVHMHFMKRLLVLPSPLVDRLVRLIYRRYIPADIAKLIALVDCNLPNTLSTWIIILLTLENLSWVDRQMCKLMSASHDRRSDQPTSAAAAAEHMTSDVGPLATSESNTASGTSNVPRSGVATSAGGTTGPRAGTSSHRTGGRHFDTDSEDDDDESHEDRLLEPSTYRLHGSGSAARSRETPVSSAALNLVLDEVIMSGAVLDQSGADRRDGQSWHAETDHDDEPVIFVHDDEDDGSAGQGAEGENSQEEDVVDEEEEEEEEEDEELGEPDDEEEEEVEDDDDDNDGDDDGNEPETDEDVIGESGSVALVLRTGASRRGLRGSRRPVTESTISVPVTGGRSTGDHEPTASTGESLRVGFQRGGNELDIHTDAQEDSDGSYDEDEDDEVDTFGRADSSAMDLLSRDSNVPVFLNSDGRLLREANFVGAVVEEVLNLVDAPQQSNSGIASRSSGYRRDRFVLAPSEFTGLNVIPTGNAGNNWGLLMPRFGVSANANGHLLGVSANTSNFPPNTTVFRFGLGTGGANTSVFVTGGNNNRITSSTNATSLANVGNNGPSQAVLPVSLPSQHPLLQIPSTLSGGTAAHSAAPASTYAAASSAVRLSRTVVANAGTTPNVANSTLPPILPGSSSTGSTQISRVRGSGSSLGPILIGTRSRGPPTRLYVPFTTDTTGFRQPPPPPPPAPDVDMISHTPSTSAPNSASQAPTGPDSIRDSRAGPESDGLIWTMLSSIAEDQPSALNSALASAFFSQFDSTVSRTDESSGGIGSNASQWAPYAGYALPAGYRRWVTMARILFGHELMDLIMIERCQIYKELAQQRQELLDRRILESASAPVTDPVTDSCNAPISGEDVSAGSLPATSAVPPEPSASSQSLATVDDASAAAGRPVQPPETLTSPAQISDITTPTEQAQTTTQDATEIPLDTTSSDPTQGTPQASSTAPAVPMTDEETVQSLIESGMDPSFLDALPEDVRREVISNHRHARRVQQELSSLTLPEHINADWLAGLPPHIQEEVLVQFRNEQQQQQQQATSSATEAAPSSATEPNQAAAEPQALHRHPDNNNADFLVGLPASLRREVLADMDESQLEMLPADLAAEARQLRRENEERFARAVQGGMLSHSFVSRHDNDRWRSLTTATGLIGGPGRWDVRFNSINQLLRHLTGPIGAPLNSGGMLFGLQNASGIRGRYLVDHEGLVCLVVLLVACSPYSQQKRNLIPTLKKVLRNLSCHFATRHWIVGTLLSLFGGLSETPLAVKGSDPAYPSDCASVPPPLANTVFHMGFEAALGCWIRIFHPIPIDAPKTKSDALGHETRGDADEEWPAPSTSSEPVPHRHVIHPQAAAFVSSILLDTLDELAKAFPAQFYPRPSGDTKQEVREKPGSNLDWPRPAFWDVFNRLAKSTPALGSSGSASQSRGSRRAHTAGRKRQSSSSSKQLADAGHHHVGSSQDLPGPTPMDTSGTAPEGATTGKSDAPVEPSHPRRRTGGQYGHSDYFVQLADLLCHPLMNNRPNHQEHLLSILAGIVKEYVLSRNLPSTTDSQPTDSQRPQAAVEVQQTSEVSEFPTATEDRARSATLSQEGSTAAAELIAPLKLDVVSALCRFVWDPVTTEMGRELAAQLIADLAHANRQTKHLMLQLLAKAAVDLSVTLSDQLQELSDELDEHMSSTSGQTPDTVPAPSSSSRVGRTNPLDVLPDRFSPAGQMVVVSSEPRASGSMSLSDLQLKSIQPFSRQNSCQIRFRGILGIVVRLAAGECSCNATEAIPVSADPPLQAAANLNEFWPRVSVVFDKLQALADPSAVLLIQPLLEAFCLAHLHLVKDSIRIRQRAANLRANRPNANVQSGSSSLVEMVPMLQLRVENHQPVTDRLELQGNESTTTHLHLDVTGPVSPPAMPVDEDEQADRVSQQPLDSGPATNAILQFAERHRLGLNQVLRQSGSALGESPFAVFLVYPRLLDFDIKRRFFRQQLQSLSPRSPLSSRYDDEPIVISRDRIFEDSYARLHRKSPADWKHKFVIRFQNEEGQDAGGPLREWYLLMSREIFNPNYCLFRTSPADRVTYTINPSSYINSNHLSYFKFVGRFVAKALYDNKLLECYFSRSFYKHILGVPVKCSDLESDDYEFYKGLEFLLKHHVSNLGYELTFSTEINEFGKTETRDLVENGRNIHVTEQNKREYIRLVCQEKMTGAIRQQLDAFLSGFYEIVPKRMISIFNEQELELLISGLPNIDIADLKANTTYSKYQLNSPQIEWFWRALESFDQEDRARFLQFVTGTSKVPLGGFANLEGMHGPTKFQISRGSTSSTHHLPCAHTCFNTLVLPAYESYEQLRTRLLTAIRECSEGYGMA